MKQQLLQRFITLEDENNLFQKKIQNVHFWSYIREYMYEEIIANSEQNIDISNNASSGGIKQKIKKIFYEIPNILFHNPFHGLEEKELLVISTPSKIYADDFFQCIYTENIIKRFTKKANVIESASYEPHKKPTEFTNVKYLDYLLIKVQVKTKIKQIFNKGSLTSQEQIYIEELIGMINKEFNISLDISKISNYIKNMLIKQKVAYRYYDKVLNKAKPKCIIEICHYEFSKLVLNEVAKDKKIKVVELQHGIIGSLHEAYNYNRIVDLPCFPDYILLFGEYWKETASFPINKENLLPVGFPYFEERTVTKTKNREQKKVFLFLSQPTIGIELSNLAVELNKVIDHNNFKVIYKLHPNEFTNWKEKYSQLANTNIEVVDNTEKDLYYYFSISNYQIGVYSTALYEGIGYGLKTFILKTFGYEYVGDLVNKRNAILIERAADILEKLNDELEDSDNISSQLWKEGSINNIATAIEGIINDL